MLPVRRFLGRFARNRGGATAIEFGAVIFPFFFMMWAVLEIGLVFVTNSELENAVVETARLVRTGQAQAQGLTKEAFKEQICNRMSVFTGQCAARANIDVRVLPQFQNPSPPQPTAAGFPNDYDIGGARQIVMVRVWYRQPLLTPFLAQALSKFDDGHAVLTATSAFRNEPF
jgi:hypothetical protein